MRNSNIKYLKISLFSSLFLIAFHVTLLAQDKIHTSNNSIIEAKVIEITQTEIKYKKFINQSGPLYTISKTDVVMIVYENGNFDEFTPAQGKQADITNALIITDSLTFIETMLGVKFENSEVMGGSVRISKLEPQSVFKPNTNMGKLYVENINNGGEPVRINNTSELSKTLFDSYNKGISKVQLNSGSKRMSNLSYFTYDNKGIDISGLAMFHKDTIAKKLSIQESKIAGNTVSKIYHPVQMWGIQGFCSGMLFGLPGVALMGIAAVFPPQTPVAPPNVDANAWTKAYKSRIKKRRLISGIIGSALGSALIIGALSSAN